MVCTASIPPSGWSRVRIVRTEISVFSKTTRPGLGFFTWFKQGRV